jgi:6,7-dimethyl-8-ribityllumazine synthase
MDSLVAAALRAPHELGIDEPTLLRVPGSFELPVAAKTLPGDGDDPIVALGVVIHGGTPHFDYAYHGVTPGRTQVSVHTGVPIGFGVLTCDTEEQARDRAGLPGSNEDKGHEAVTAVVATAVTLRSPSEPWRRFARQIRSRVRPSWPTRHSRSRVTPPHEGSVDKVP